MSDEIVKRLISNPNMSSEERQELIKQALSAQSNSDKEDKDFDHSYKNQVLSLLQSIDDKLSVLIKQIDRRLI